MLLVLVTYNWCPGFSGLAPTRARCALKHIEITIPPITLPLVLLLGQWMEESDREGEGRGREGRGAGGGGSMWGKEWGEVKGMDKTEHQ